MFLAGITRYGWIVCAALPLWASAQSKLTNSLGELPSPSVRKQTPTFVFADWITARPDLEVKLEGNAELRKTDTVIKAKRLDYNQTTDRARASGDVTINRLGNRYWGPELVLDVSDFSGFFEKPQFKFIKNGGQGSADRIDFVDERRAIATNTLFSSCKRPETLNGKPWKPDWILSADKVVFDVGEDIATATGAVLRFKDVPFLTTPSFSFPMSDTRKSGLLAPSIVIDSQSGTEITQPYYWNIAPNRDVTLSPSTISKRGINLSSEFRYLEPRYNGTIRADYLPSDRLYGNSRWGWTSEHVSIIDTGLTNVSPIGLKLSINKVSDNDYWRDFPRASGALTQRLLASELLMNASIDGWQTQARLQRWQTLQAADSPITPPFDRWPQMTLKRSFVPAVGWQAAVEADYTQFISKPDLTHQPNGTRVFAVAALSRPWVKPSGFLTPKLQLHSSAYQLDHTNAGLNARSSRFVPTLSLDSGLFFEREAVAFNRALVQTLEPRLYYVYTPFRDQRALPNYDSGAKDFNFGTIYSDNAFVGNDRIADANTITLGLTSRLLDAKTGTEAIRTGLAQRFRLTDQLVTLPGGTPDTHRQSDYLAQLGVNWTPQWSTDSTVQFGSTSHQSERTTISTSYNPGKYRTFYGAYRLQKDVSEQLDLGWQWPINAPSSTSADPSEPRWYSVARLNYSLRDQRMVDAIVGFEYDADCWIGRIVLEQNQTSLSANNRRIMFQLELGGFARIGVSPIASLRRSIPRYQNLREQTTTPSRFSQYD